MSEKSKKKAFSYLYVCEGCMVVKALKADYGSVHLESCKVCNECQFHNKIEVRNWPYKKSDEIEVISLGEEDDSSR